MESISVKQEQTSDQINNESQSIDDTEERPFRCDLCGVTFKRKAYMDRHVERHRDEREHQCKLCSKSFNCKDYLRTHVKTVHNVEYDDLLPPEPPDKDFVYSCTLCGVELNPSEFRRHKKLHTEIAEPESDDELGDSADHDNDKNSVSEDEGSHSSKNNASKGVVYTKVIFRCSICNQKCKSLIHIQDHLRKHSGEKPFRCKVDGCGKTFGHSSGLRNHERVTHTDERPFCCKFCGKSYKRRHQLNEHEIMHEDNLPKSFLCHLCEKSFKTRKKLAQHIRTHQNSVDQFKCNFCPKSFKHSRYYRLHLKKDHPINLSTSNDNVDYDTT